MFEIFQQKNAEFINRISEEYKKTVILKKQTGSTYNPTAGKTEQTYTTQTVTAYVSNIDDKLIELNQMINSDSQKVEFVSRIADVDIVEFDNQDYKVVFKRLGANYTLLVVNKI